MKPNKHNLESNSLYAQVLSSFSNKTMKKNNKINLNQLKGKPTLQITCNGVGWNKKRCVFVACLQFFTLELCELKSKRKMRSCGVE